MHITILMSRLRLVQVQGPRGAQRTRGLPVHRGSHNTTITILVANGTVARPYALGVTRAG